MGEQVPLIGIVLMIALSQVLDHAHDGYYK
jgi:hypothetical protein